MGQKINPIALRLQYPHRFFDFCWYSDFFYTDLFLRDIQTQQYLSSLFKQLNYPSPRFFIQNASKKTKIAMFFCSPIEHRQIQSKIFDLPNYKSRFNYFQLNKSFQKQNYIEKGKSQLLNSFEKKVEFHSQNMQWNAAHIKFFLKKYEMNSSSLLVEKNKIQFDFVKKQFYCRNLITFYLFLRQYTNIKSSFSYKNFLLFFFLSQSFQLKNLSKHINFFENRSGVNKIKMLQSFDKKKTQNQTAFFLQKQLGSIGFRFFETNFLANLTVENSLINKELIETHISRLHSFNNPGNVELYPLKTIDFFRSAQFVAEDVVYFLQRRVSFRRIKNRIEKQLQNQTKIKGIRISCSGRVGGRSKKAQRSRIESFKYGQTSLHIFSSKIDFASKTAFTRFGTLGIKVWICYA